MWVGNEPPNGETEMRDEGMNEQKCPTCGSNDKSLFLGRCQDEVDRVAERGGAIIAAVWHRAPASSRQR